MMRKDKETTSRRAGYFLYSSLKHSCHLLPALYVYTYDYIDSPHIQIIMRLIFPERNISNITT